MGRIKWGEVPTCLPVVRGLLVFRPVVTQAFYKPSDVAPLPLADGRLLVAAGHGNAHPPGAAQHWAARFVTEAYWLDVPEWGTEQEGQLLIVRSQWWTRYRPGSHCWFFRRDGADRSHLLRQAFLREPDVKARWTVLQERWQTAQAWLALAGHANWWEAELEVEGLPLPEWVVRGAAPEKE